MWIGMDISVVTEFSILLMILSFRASELSWGGDADLYRPVVVFELISVFRIQETVGGVELYCQLRESVAGQYIIL